MQIQNKTNFFDDQVSVLICLCVEQLCFFMHSPTTMTIVDSMRSISIYDDSLTTAACNCNQRRVAQPVPLSLTYNHHRQQSIAPLLHHRCNDDLYERVPDRIFVGLLHKTSNEADLQLLFSQYAPIRRVEIMRDTSGVSKCCGFVTFESIAAADRVLARLATDGVVYQGRRWNIEPAICRRFVNSPIVDNDHGQRQQSTMHPNDSSSTTTTMFEFNADTRNLHTFIGNSTKCITKPKILHLFDREEHVESIAGRQSNYIQQRIVSNYLFDVSHMNMFGSSKLAPPTMTNILLADTDTTKYELIGDPKKYNIQWWS
jgi:hypothetical protein